MDNYSTAFRRHLRSGWWIVHALEYLKHKGIKVNISLNPRNRHKPKLGRPYRLLYQAYKRMRSAVECLFAWLKSFRRLTIRYERLIITFLAFIQVACIAVYLRVLQ